MLGLTTLTNPIGRSAALGITYRVSGLCDRASLSSSSGKIVQILRDAVWASSRDNSTTYRDGAQQLILLCSPFHGTTATLARQTLTAKTAQSFASVSPTLSQFLRQMVLSTMVPASVLV